MRPPFSIDAFFVADLRGVGHLYRPYARETVCGKNKVHRDGYYWWNWEGPFCDECLIESRMEEMEHGRVKRGIAA